MKMCFSVSCSLHLFMFLLCSASLPSHLSNARNPRIKAMEHCMSDMNLLKGDTFEIRFNQQRPCLDLSVSLEHFVTFVLPANVH